MNDSPETASLALLPAGLRDVLPADAAFESDVGRDLLAIFARHGYEQVAPPLVEFEDSFLSGTGAAMARDSFRLMDPVSQRMMVVRSDITPQVARIATTRLAGAPRPLRLAYIGQVLLARGRQLRPQRQFRQAGVELVVASDANPGTAPTESLPLAMAMAVRSYGLTATEAILAATRHAADALDHEGGWLVEGGPADLVLWDLPHEHDLIQPWGVSRVRATLRRGRVIAGRL